MASGVAVSDDCLTAYQELKLGRKSKYIIYALNPTNTEIVVDKVSQEDDYQQFVSGLPADECRFAILDFAYEVEGEGKRNKIVFFTWSPDAAKIKQKMIYASSRDALRRSFVGIAAEIQATDQDEISFETVSEKVKRGTR